MGATRHEDVQSQTTAWASAGSDLALEEKAGPSHQSAASEEVEAGAPRRTVLPRDFGTRLLRGGLTASLVVSLALGVEVAGAVPAGAAAGQDRLDAGESLHPDQRIVSRNGEYFFIFQRDGNAVIYQGKQAIWSTKTNGRTGSLLAMQRDGNVVAYGQGNRPMWASNTAGRPGTVLIMQDDANLVAYAPGNRPVWSSGTSRAAGSTRAAARAPSAPRDVRVVMTGNAAAGTASITWKPPDRGADQVKAYRVRVDGNSAEWEGTSWRWVPSGTTSVQVRVAGTRLVRATVWAVNSSDRWSSSSTSKPSRAQLKVQADHLMRVSLGEFILFKEQQVRLSARYRLPFNWTDDSCSGPTPPVVDEIFNDPCERHDFGYRNFGNGLRLQRSRARKDMVDGVLHRDARDRCRGLAMADEKSRRHCLNMADDIARAVRTFGGPAFFG